jgi:hypothetical protein
MIRHLIRSVSLAFIGGCLANIVGAAIDYGLFWKISSFNVFYFLCIPIILITIGVLVIFTKITNLDGSKLQLCIDAMLAWLIVVGIFSISQESFFSDNNKFIELVCSLFIFGFFVLTTIVFVIRKLIIRWSGRWISQ